MASCDVASDIRQALGGGARQHEGLAPRDLAEGVTDLGRAVRAVPRLTTLGFSA